MPTVWVTGTTGPWLCDDSEVLCDGEAYLGPVYPWLDGGLFDGVALTIGDNAYIPAVSKDASYVPTYSKVGTP